MAWLQGLVLVTLLGSGAAFVPSCPGVARSHLGARNVPSVTTMKPISQAPVGPLYAGPAELEFVVKNLLAGQNPTVLATVGVGVAAFAALAAYVSHNDHTIR